MSVFFSALVIVGSMFLCKLEAENIRKLKAMRFGIWMIFGVIILYLIWGFYTGWLCFNIYTNIHELISPTPAPARRGDGLEDILAMIMAGSGLQVGRMSEGLSLLFNLWTLFGCAALMVVRVNPWRWGRWSRVTIAGFCAGLMLGRPLVGWLSWVGTLLPTSGVLVALTYTLGPPLCLFIAGLWAIQIAADLISWQVILLFTYIVVIPVVLFNQILKFDQQLQIYQYQKQGLIGYIARFGAWLRRMPLTETPDDSKGARFATPEEIKALQKQDGDAFGHIDGSPLLLQNEKHTLIMASTRSGKGVSLIIPHLLRYAGSVFVLDPKGENARATHRRRAELNDRVLILDPFGISGLPQARFNPFSRFTPENMEAESKALAAALIMNPERDHWTASAEQLLAAFILFVVASPSIPAERKDLGTVRRLLLGKWPKTLKAMTLSGLMGGLIPDLAESFIMTPEKELGSIVSTAQRETEILDNPYIRKCLAASGAGEAVDFKTWRKGTMSVFLCLSAPKFPVFSRWLRLVLTSALDDMTDTLNPPPLPVCFMLDELATLGHLQPVENAIGLAAGYGIQIWAVFQDLAQMKDLYKSRWASFISNAGVRAVFSLEDYDTALYWSKFTGNRLVQTLSEAQNIYGIAQNQNVGEAVRPLLTPDEVMLQFAGKGQKDGQATEPEEMLVFPQGSRPIRVKRVAYFHDPELEGLWDDPRRPVREPVTV